MDDKVPTSSRDSAVHGCTREEMMGWGASICANGERSERAKIELIIPEPVSVAQAFSKQGPFLPNCALINPVWAPLPSTLLAWPSTLVGTREEAKACGTDLAGGGEPGGPHMPNHRAKSVLLCQLES